MKTPAIRREGRCRLNGGEAPSATPRERGVTMLLVAVAMVAIIAMAALSIDVVTLYLAREEAQRAADAAALAAARVISVSGITSTANPATDTTSWAAICGAAGSATKTAQAVGIQNSVGQISATTTVTYSAGGSSGSDCSALPVAFAVNPMVTVQITRSSMPTFFSRIWGNRGNNVSATATAEAFNPSDSGNVDNGPTGSITPVLPSCVKPIIVPNQDPMNPSGCTPATPCHSFVSKTDGSITHAGISLNGTGANGTIGETFWLVPDCQRGAPGNCKLFGAGANLQPRANHVGGASIKGPPNLLFAPGQVGTPVVAVPSCTEGGQYEEAIEGCDESTNYQCGAPPPNNNVADLTQANPGDSGALTNGVQCLTGQTDDTNFISSSGQDYLNPFGAPSAYPYQILAGSSNPLTSLSGKPITSSNSIISLPIYDDGAVTLATNTATNVTFIGFLQVFVNAVDQYGNINVTVLNVTGCSNGAVGNPDPVGSPVLGTSPVPIRLITPP